MSSLPDSPNEVNEEPSPVYVLPVGSLTWHRLRGPGRELTLCGTTGRWTVFTTSAPDATGICPACARVEFLTALVGAGGAPAASVGWVEPRDDIQPWHAGHDGLPWLRRREGAARARYLLQPDRPPAWRRLLRRLGR
jgi:hypothetical protein